MKIIQVIPFKNFKERIRIVKENIRNSKVIVYKDFVYVETDVKKEN